jgi:phenylpropionate dioxygenase-like ring-hydroxylating dioxygenase large terminal subunit
MGADLAPAPAAYASDGATGARRFPFTPYPTGWYRVAATRDFGADQVRSLRCFGQDLVLFRPGGAAPAVLDAHCPHLGAHLGHGGRVVDGALVCPFHGWRFDAAGHCIGNRQAAPTRGGAQLRTWSVREANGAVMLWFDQAGRPPLWDVPDLPEWRDPAWSRFRPTKPRQVRTHVQELAENGIDLAHFSAIHGDQIARVESDGLTIDNQTLTHRIRNGFAGRITTNRLVFGPDTDGISRLPGRLAFTYHGLGTMICRADVAGRFPVSFVTVLYFLPLDDGIVLVAGESAIRRCGLLTRPLLARAVREAEKAIADDTAILENKRYMTRPHLGEADGPIMPYRHWARQFYPASSPDC